jgi:hypothetical protein
MKDIISYMLIALAMMAFLIPACVQGDTTLAAGQTHVVQIDKDMGMWTWGGNINGQLSLGHNTDQVSQIVLNGLPYPYIILFKFPAVAGWGWERHLYGYIALSLISLSFSNLPF